MRKKAFRTQAEWAVYEVDRWMDRMKAKRTLAPDWNIEFWPALANNLEEVAEWIREQMGPPVVTDNVIEIPKFMRTKGVNHA